MGGRLSSFFPPQDSSFSTGFFGYRICARERDSDEQCWEGEALSDAQDQILARHIGIPLKDAVYAWDVAERGYGFNCKARLDEIVSPVLYRFYNIMTAKIQTKWRDVHILPDMPVA
jgi:hypothetical protein